MTPPVGISKGSDVRKRRRPPIPPRSIAGCGKRASNVPNAVLRDFLGYDAERIAALRKDGIVV